MITNNRLQVLEIASGTSVLGRSIAPKVGNVTGIDLTEEMLKVIDLDPIEHLDDLRDREEKSLL